MKISRIKIILLSIVAVFVVGIVIPKFTVYDLVHVDAKLNACVEDAINLHYDNPFERLVLYFSKSRITSADINSATIESFTLFRIPFGVLRGQLALRMLVNCNFPEPSLAPDTPPLSGLGQYYQEAPVVGGTKAYRSDKFGISFVYPENYLLFEGQGEGAEGIEYYGVSVIPDSPHLREVMSGTDGETGTHITLIFYREPKYVGSLEEWVRAKMKWRSGLDFPETTYTKTMVAGAPALRYLDVSGLYQRDTVLFAYGEWIVEATADDASYFKTDFDKILSSIRLKL